MNAESDFCLAESAVKKRWVEWLAQKTRKVNLFYTVPVLYIISSTPAWTNKTMLIVSFTQEISFWSSEDEINNWLCKGFVYENRKLYLMPFDLLAIRSRLVHKGENMRFCHTVEDRHFREPAPCFDIFEQHVAVLSAVTSFPLIKWFPVKS